MKLSDYKEIYYNGVELKEIKWNGVTQWKKIAPVEVSFTLSKTKFRHDLNDPNMDHNLDPFATLEIVLTSEASGDFVFDLVGSPNDIDAIDFNWAETNGCTHSFYLSNSGSALVGTYEYDVIFEPDNPDYFCDDVHRIEIEVYTSENVTPSYSCRYCGTSTSNSNEICGSCQTKLDNGAKVCEECEEHIVSPGEDCSCGNWHYYVYTCPINGCSNGTDSSDEPCSTHRNYEYCDICYEWYGPYDTHDKCHDCGNPLDECTCDNEEETYPCANPNCDNRVDSEGDFCSFACEDEYANTY